MFGLRFHVSWTFAQFAIVLLQPIALYLLAIVALPSSSAPSLDLRSSYFEHRRWFFGLLALSAASRCSRTSAFCLASCSERATSCIG